MTWSQQFGTSIFTEITQAAMAGQAINLAQGFPDFDGPDIVKEAAIKAIRDGFNQYAPSIGIPELRQKLAYRYSERLQQSLCSEKNVTVVSGCTEAIFLTLRALHRDGDEVLTFAPYYDAYDACSQLCNLKLKAVPLDARNGWSFSLKELAAAITPKTRSIILNTPHNPTGKVFNQAELSAIADLARKHELIVITDEVYEELVFDDHKHLSIASLPGMWERTIVMSSAAKNYSMTGWKIGYIFANERFSKEIRSVHQFIVFCSATPLQHGIAAALDLDEGYYRGYIEDYDSRRLALCDILLSSGFEVFKPMGSYFIVADFSALSQLSDREFVSRMIDLCGVAAIPISPFYPKELQLGVRRLRFAFCKSMDTIIAAGEKLKIGLKNL